MANNTLIEISENKKSNKDKKITTKMNTNQEDIEYKVNQIIKNINYTIEKI